MKKTIICWHNRHVSMSRREQREVCLLQKRCLQLFFYGEGYIYGEVYEADELCIHKLDQFFQGYHKQTVFVETDVGIKNALIYFMNKDGFAGFTKISSGDWKEHQMISKSKNPIYYFAYGSCMDNARFQKAGVDHYFQDPVGRAVLKGYTTRFTLKRDDGSRADMLEDGGTTEGVLYRIPYSALSYLYKREGVESLTYRPAFVDVKLAVGTTKTA